MKKGLIIKVVFVILLWIGYVSAYDFIYPIITTKVAMNQLADTDTSYLGYKMVETTLNYYLPIILGCFTALIFRKNIIQVINKGEKNE